ncbi:MAG TPA: hypothetical protein PKB10_02340 [Tepidisphaeraceae bacterium]|nr:hypothetical protein [Tepidisphaeraceae bacterium]
MSTLNFTNSLERIKSLIRQDPKKAGVLVLLALVLGGMWARTLLGGKPATAQATGSKPAASVTQRQTAAAPVRRTTSDPATARVMDWLSGPPPATPRNMFALRPEYFRTDNAPAGRAKGSTDRIWESLEKSIARGADDRRRQAILLENLRREAARLRLQTTVMGVRPSALIDGRLVYEGDVVAAGSGQTRIAFRVLTIEARRVVIEHEGIRLDLTMKQ